MNNKIVMRTYKEYLEDYYKMLIVLETGNASIWNKKDH